MLKRLTTQQRSTQLEGEATLKWLNTWLNTGLMSTQHKYLVDQYFSHSAIRHSSFVSFG